MSTLFETEGDVEAKLLQPLFTGTLGYSASDMSWKRTVRLDLGTETKTTQADLVILHNDKPVITVEAKKPTEPVRSAMGQVDSYAFALKTPISVVTNGRHFVVRRYFSFVDRINVIDETVDLLKSRKWRTVRNLIGIDNIEASIGEQANAVAEPSETEIRNYRRFFRRLHSEIRDRDKLDPGAAFDELSKLLFMRAAEDEWEQRGKKPRPALTPEQIGEWEKLGKKRAQALINEWFRGAVEGLYPGVFEENSKLNLKPSTLRELLPIMKPFHVIGGDVDVKGRAFEEFLPSQLRGKGLGQFFTPRRVVNFMADMAGISIQDVVVDFSCGSGGFLIKAFEQMQRGVEQLPVGTLKRIGTTREDILDDIRSDQIFGIDAEPRAARTAKMNMLMWGDGRRVVRGNALDTKDDSGKTYRPKEYKPSVPKSGCTLILANPPFGSREKDQQILKKYELGAKYQKRKAEKTEILFLEKGLKLLRPEGKMLIVLPQGLMSGDNHNRVRDFIHSQAEIRAVVSLPTHTFVQSGVPTVNTCVLYIQKFTSEKKRLYDARAFGLADDEVRKMIRTNPDLDYPIFMGTAEYVGYEPSGRDIGAPGEKTDLDLLLEDFAAQADLASPQVDMLALAMQQYGDRSSRRRDQVVRGTMRGLKTSFVVPLSKTEDRLDPPYYLFRSQAVELLKAMRPLGNTVQEVKDRFGKQSDEDLDAEHSTLTVSSDGTVTLNERLRGEVIASSYKRVRAGDIAYNPMRVNIGSIGVVPPGLDKGLVSPDYVVFRSKKYDPRFLVTMLRSPFYRMYIDVITTGSIRDRLYFRNLKTIRLPEIITPEQLAICEAALTAEAQAQDLLARVAGERLQLVNRINRLVQPSYVTPRPLVKPGSDADDRGADAEFARLADQWTASRSRGVDIHAMANSPAYQAILRMGARAIRPILLRLERQPDHWFHTLHAITGANPVPPESEGKLSAMTEAWLRGGESRGTSKMSIAWVDREIPLAVGKYLKTSDKDGGYNCIAYAAGKTDEWWQHTPGYKWPAYRSPLIDSLVAVFVGLGYQVCTTDAVEPGYDKVALYANGAEWSHAARQKNDGKWTSKLGPDEDIEHDTPDCICGTSYGAVHCIMRRLYEQQTNAGPEHTPGPARK